MNAAQEERRAPAPASGPTEAPAAPAAPKRKSARPRIIAAVVLSVVAVAGVSYWAYARQFEETDDAQIDASISTVSARVAGTIKAIYVRENQAVKAGDPLAELDPADLEVAAARARAAVAQAQAQLEAEDPSVPIVETSNSAAVASATSDIASAGSALAAAQKEVDQLTAQLAQAKANDKNAQTERERAEKLIAQGAISQADFDQRTNAATASAASVDALAQALAAAKDRVGEQQARLAAAQTHLTEVKANAPRQVETRKASVLVRQASLDLAKAELAQAELNLSYAKLAAPVAGIVGKKAVALGDRVAPGQALMAISQIDDLWVTANFRETQLERMHPGQTATVHVDSIDVDLQGTIESVGGATGARFSVLPPENASGNYVKVVQRIPVRIHIDASPEVLARLRPGMSVEPKVRVR